MEDIESKISQILSDPGAMASILSMAKGLGLGPRRRTPLPSQTAIRRRTAPADDAAPSGDLPFFHRGASGPRPEKWTANRPRFCVP